MQAVSHVLIMVTFGNVSIKQKDVFGRVRVCHSLGSDGASDIIRRLPSDPSVNAVHHIKTTSV